MFGATGGGRQQAEATLRRLGAPCERAHLGQRTQRVAERVALLVELLRVWRQPARRGARV